MQNKYLLGVGIKRPGELGGPGGTERLYAVALEIGATRYGGGYCRGL